MFLAACASPRYQAPPLDEAKVAVERKAAVRDAMETALERRARVYDLSWPVLTANTELCPRTRPTIGVVLADRERLARLAGGLRDEDLEEIGVSDDLVLVHVFAGSPAETAGVTSGGRLLAVNGKPVTDPEKAAEKIREGTKDEGRVVLTLGEGGEERDIEVSPVESCDMAVKISTSQAINAHAATGDIVIYTGVIRALGDEALQFLIAHEAAHLAADHRRKYIQNTVVSGAGLVGPFLYGGAWVADMAARIGDRPDISFRSRVVHGLAPWAKGFEEEADYLGAYMFARAGGELSAAREVYDVFSRETPVAIYLRATHPLTPERQVRLAATIAEIEGKRLAGDDLMPERARP